MTNTQQITYLDAPFETVGKGLQEVYGERVGDVIEIQKAITWRSEGKISIPKCKHDNSVAELLKIQLLTFDLLFTFAGYLFSISGIIIGIITANSFTLIVGTFTLIPMITHTIHGIKIRWKKIIEEKNQD